MEPIDTQKSQVETWSVQQGDLSKTGGSPTYRFGQQSLPVSEDDPSTTNNENNDQPTGFFGTVTLIACTLHNSSCYKVDADINQSMVQRLYFPKGGWIDFSDGNYDGQVGWGEDENSRKWKFEAVN